MSEIAKAWAGPGRMLAAALLSGITWLGCGQSARAQFAFEDDILPPRVVAWRLAERGYGRLGRPRFDGRVYVVDAVSPNGVPVRLFVDPAVGAVVGRQRLGPPETYARLEPPRPGFGWTEEDVRPRPALRPLPEANPEPSRPRAGAPRPGVAAARPDANPYGLNPDAPARADPPRAEPPRKVARTAPPARQPDLKPALRTAPEAPAPQIAPAQAERASGVRAEPPAAGTTVPDAAPARPEGTRAEAAKPAAGAWKDPPPDRRPVRVIDGATVVPGTAGAPGKDAEPAP